MEPAPPFRLDLTVWVLRRRAQNVWDRWDGQTYRRVLAAGCGPVEVAVSQTGPPDTPRLRVVGASVKLPPDATAIITSALERLLGIRTDLNKFYEMAGADLYLAPLVQAYRGFKPPRYLSLFEALVNAISCQQLTLTVGVVLLNRISERYGAAFPSGNPGAHAFPRPEDLAGSDVEALRAMGFSRQKSVAILGLARAVTDDGLDLSSLEFMDDETALKALLRLRGIGRWTAEYVLLRGIGRLHIFPGDDVGGRNNLQHWLHLPGPLDYEGVERAVRPWQPFAGLLYFHLLLDRLADAGHIEAFTEPNVGGTAV
ncbi:MAG TPA: hypothetical protein VKT75_11450 [Acidobacteriaceae bacterium]|nr:hypothetical protein [Acidobacteriaceae bacterium]